MHGCNGCQELMLEYLYDLLDSADHQALEAHLAGCAACQSVLQKVQGQQHLLAAAARLEFPAVIFQPPEPAREEPPTLPLPAAPERPRVRSVRLVWHRLALAASLLLALGGSAVWVSRDYSAARHTIAHQEEAVAGARSTMQEVERDLNAAAENRDRQIEAVHQAEKARELRLVVTGPGNVQPGAPADYLVRAYDLNTQPTSANIIARLDDRRANATAARRTAPTAPAPDTFLGTSNGSPKGDAFPDRAGGAKESPGERGGGKPEAVVKDGSPLPGPTSRSKEEKEATSTPAPPRATPGMAPGFVVPGPLRKDQDAEYKLESDVKKREKGEKETHQLALGYAPLPVESIGNGLYKIKVPPTLPLQPNSELTMVVEASRNNGGGIALSERVQLTTPVYLTHLMTDRPMYQPGDTVYFRSLTVDRFSLEPAREDFQLRYTLTTPTGETCTVLQGRNTLLRADGKGEVIGPDGKPLRGIGAGQFQLDPAIRGGEYALTVSEEARRFPPQSRKFLVNRYQPPRLDKKLEFNRPTYGPGDEVQVSASASSAGGGPLAHRSVEVAVALDDHLYDGDGLQTSKPFTVSTNADGKALICFRLPAQIERGVGSLGLTFHDGGAVESLVRTIPLVLHKLDVEFFPEGGDLIAGLPNRVYFQARTPAGKPAELSGVLVENNQALPVTIATLHDDREPGVNQGTGTFTFTPKAGRKYELRIDSPVGIAQRVPLPPVREDGVVLHLPKRVVSPNEPIRAQVLSTRPRSLMVGAYCRGRVLDSVQVGKDQTEVLLSPTIGAGGVCRVTVFEELPATEPRPPGSGGPTAPWRSRLCPVAERLFYRHPAERLDVSIKPDQRRYVPGQKSKLSLATTDETEKLRASVITVAVVDRSTLTLADEKTARTMPTHFLLTTEIRRAEDLEHADFLLEPTAKAATALDLLLGTQGWRRFAEQDPAHFRERLRAEAQRLPDEERKRSEEEGERLLVMIGQSSPRTTNFDQQKIDQVLEEYTEQVGKLHEQRQEAATVVAAAGQDQAYRAALDRALGYHHLLDRVRAVSGPVAVGLLVIVVVLVFLRWRVGLTGSPRWRFGLVCGALASVLLLVWLHKAPFEEPPTDPLAVEIADLPTPEAADKPVAEVAPQATPQAPAREDGTAEKPAAAAKPPAPPASLPKSVALPERVTSELAANQVEQKGATRGKELRLPSLAKQTEQEWSAALRRNSDLDQMQPADKALRAGLLGAEDTKKRLADEQLLYFRILVPDAAESRRFRAQDGRGLRERESLAAPMVVREYAHQRKPTPSPEDRSDFAETLCWQPALVLPDGRVELSFDLCDSVTTFQVIAVAHSLDGRLGTGTARLEVRPPLAVQPTVPLEVTAGDRLDVPVRLANYTGAQRAVTVDLKEHEGLELLDGIRTQTVDLLHDDPARRLYGFRPTLHEGLARLSFAARAEGAPPDSVRETIRVVPEGFPVNGAQSDVLEKSATHTLELPGSWVKGTLHCRVDVYPSPLADLQKGLDSLLREPHGCFEQTSSSNYPNLLILDYLKESEQVNPPVERRARELLATGYQRLTSFECQEPGTQKRRGYEWFGGTAPPHEALTAYGLLEFRDMARVYPVDPLMVRRTRDYLMGQRDGKGGFRRNEKALGSFGRAPAHLTDAYIVWALTESGQQEELTTELNALAGRAQKETDPYFLALVGNSLLNRGRASEARVLLEKVAGGQKDDGRLEATQTSITGSGGRDLQIEATSLAVLGWLKGKEEGFREPIRKAVGWIGRQRSGTGGFGSTQATILALKALLAHARENRKPAEAGELSLFTSAGKVAGLTFPARVNTPLTLELPEPEKHLRPGKSTLRVEITGNNVFPHTLSWSYRTLKPLDAEGCPVRLTTTLARHTLTEGEIVRLNLRLRNVSGQGQGMAVAIVGLPGGLSVPTDARQLKEYQRGESGQRPRLAMFEMQGRELILYWRDLAAGEVIDVPLDLIARVPGEYRGPASRAYLYYNADRKYWAEPLEVKVTAR
jgi:hypothetical protein